MNFTCGHGAGRAAVRSVKVAKPNPPEAVRLTHQQLANLVGATRERTTAALGALAQAGLVTLRRGRVVIRDPAGLMTHADMPDADGPPLVDNS